MDPRTRLTVRPRGCTRVTGRPLPAVLGLSIIRWTVGLAIASIGLAAGLAAQAEAKSVQAEAKSVQAEAESVPQRTTADRPEFEAREFEAPDGSRFVLVRTSGPPVVHWCWLTPAGPMEDPPGQPGLAQAVARAAVRGTDDRQAMDNAGEVAALETLDSVEREVMTREISGESISPQLRAALDRARRRADSLADHSAWERKLQSAPALDVRVDRTTDAALLHVTTTPAGIPRVAQSLWYLREGTRLRGVHRELRGIRAADAVSGDQPPLTGLRRELIGLAFLRHPYSRAFGGSRTALPSDRRQMVTTYQRTHHPSRGVHVLVGNFDPKKVERVLTGMFARTGLPRPPSPETPEPPRGGLRRATLPPAGTTGKARPHAEIAIGFTVPNGTPRAELDALVEWLAGGPQGFIQRSLRRFGHFAAMARGVAPFPTSGRAGILLLEVRDPAARTAEAAAALYRDVGRSLQSAMENGPTETEMASVAGRVRSRLALRRIAPEALATHVAIATAIEGRPVDAALGPCPKIDTAAVLRLARRVLPERGRAVVSRQLER